MAKEKQSKKSKLRDSKYESKLAIDRTFDEVIKASFLGKPKKTVKNKKNQ